MKPTSLSGCTWTPAFAGDTELGNLFPRGESKVAFYVYIMASRRNGTLYIGSTDSMTRRAWEHREGLRAGFTRKYGVHMLVWYEACDTREGAKIKERQMKEWRRSWKLRLIEEHNPEWTDLYETLNS